MTKKPFLLGMLVALLAANLLARVPDSISRSANALEQLDLILDVRHEIVDQYVEEPDQEKLVRQAVRGMVEALEDPYTSYLSPDDLKMFDKQVRGSFSGIGAEVTIDQKIERLKIVTPLEDSPAWKAGVMAGDIVLEIDGESTQGMDINTAVDKLTGPAGTQVTVHVRHESGEEHTMIITRGKIEIATVRGVRRKADHHWDYMLDPTNGVGYIRMTQFSGPTQEAMREAIQELLDQDARALVLDLRFNPGGLLDAAVAISDMFLEPGERIVSVKGRTVEETVYEAESAPLLPTDFPVVVLANEASASASEILTGALAENGRAQFVGTRTFGKGSVQQVRMLPSGQGAIKITNAYYYLPEGRNIHRREGEDIWGVDPAEGFYVPMEPEELKKMLEIRRDSDVLRENDGEDAGQPITPEWIRENMADKQLAAGLEAALGKLKTGDWPEVGSSGVEALVAAAKRKRLMDQKALLQERIEEIESELADPEEVVKEVLPDEENMPAELEPGAEALEEGTEDEAELEEAAP